MKKKFKKKSVCILLSLIIGLIGITTVPYENAYAYGMTPAATDDYTTWKQTSSSWGEARPWPNASIPKFGDAGCWITSVAILLRHYNVVTDSNVNTFNPLICNNRLMQYGIVNLAGDYCNLPNINKAYPGFEYAGQKAYSLATLKSLYDQGYACIVHETRGHYVAVRSVSSSGAVVMDPGYSTTSLTNSDSIQYYKVTGRSQPTNNFYNANLNVNPEGCLDSVFGGNGTITVRGWAFDRNADQALSIHVYVGGTYSNAKWGTDRVVANKFRPDVDNVFRGAGSNHGFEETISVPLTGTYDVYVYAINIGRSSGSNYNTCLGHKTVTIASPNVDTTPPNISNLRVTEQTQDYYTVSCTVTDNVKVTRVLFPTWTISGGQDDLIWHAGTISGNTASCTIRRSDHKNEFGDYVTDVYAYDAAGNTVSQRTGCTLKPYQQPEEPTPTVTPAPEDPGNSDKESPVISDVEIRDVNSKGYTVVCKVRDNQAVDKVQFQSWEAYKGMDDLVKADGKREGDLFKCSVKVSEHKKRLGKYQTYIYAYDQAGNMSTFKIKSIDVTKDAYRSVANGVYQIAARNDNSKVLQISDASQSNGAMAVISSRQNMDNQKFKIAYYGGGYYYLIAQHSGKALDVKGASRKSKTTLQQYKWNKTKAQLFRFESTGDGYCYIRSKLGTYIDLRNGDTEDNTQVWMYTKNKSNAQKWKLYFNNNL